MDKQFFSIYIYPGKLLKLVNYLFPHKVVPSLNLNLNLNLILILILPFLFLSFSSFSQGSYSDLFEMNEFEISHVGFNTPESDFGPSFVGDELWFSAYNAKDLKKAKKGLYKGIYYSLFKSTVDTRGFTQYEPRVQVNDFATGFHEGPVSYCPSTGELFVTLSNSISIDILEDGILKRKDKIRLRIVSCLLRDGHWVIKEEMPFNDKLYSVGHPSVSPSGDTLFFTSDNPSLGKGGTDIFMVTRKNGSWGQPVALGEGINSAGDEMFPFYYQTGVLIFASDGRNDSQGGLDLYCSEITPDGFSAPKPLPQFNSQYDDFGLMIHPLGESGYFVSNRPGQNGNDDIFMVKIRKTFAHASGRVVDVDSGKPVAGAKVELLDCMGKKIDNCVVGEDGKFFFKVLRGGCYVAGASATEYSIDRKTYGKESSVELQLKHDRSLEITILDYDTRQPLNNVRFQIDNLPPVPVSEEGVYFRKLGNEKLMNVNITAGGYMNQAIVVNTTIDYHTKVLVLMMKLEEGKSFVLDSIIFEPGSAEIGLSQQHELDKFLRFMKENPAIKIELSSHTDSRDSDKNNLILSQKRAETIVDYLVKNGLPRKRVVAKGYGETKLRNRCTNGVECTDEEHQLNNRIEFKIVGFVK